MADLVAHSTMQDWRAVFASGSRRRATARLMIPLANRLAKIFLPSVVDFAMLVFVLVLARIVDRKFCDFN